MTTDTRTDLDAFPGTDAEDDEDATDEALGRIDAATGGTSGTPSPGFERLELAATLQDGRFAVASNGDNYDLQFETDVEGFVRLAVEVARGKGAYALTWKQIHVGDGAEVRRGAWTRDADGEPHYKFNIHLPESEIARSIGRIAPHRGARAKLVLEPMQGNLGLPGGTEVDLTAKAE